MTQGHASLRAEAQLVRWRSVKIAIVMAGFGAGTVSGLVLYFLEPFVGKLGATGTLHWIVGVALIVPYVVYQWPHYINNRSKADRLHYKAGLWTFLSIVAMVISGIALIFVPFSSDLTNRLIDIAHLFTSFVFIMLLGGHLVLVSKLTLQRTQETGRSERQSIASINRLVYWIPLLASCVFFIAVWLAS